MKEVKYYVSDDETKQSFNPEEIREYEAHVEEKLKKDIQELFDFYRAEEVGYVAIVNNRIWITYFGSSNPQILKKIKNRLGAYTTFSKAHGYIVDKKGHKYKI